MVDSRFQQANADLQAGRTREAEEGYQQVIAVNPSHADALFQLGIMRYRQRRLPEAAGFLRNAVDARPNDAALLNALGAVLAQTGQIQEAATIFAESVRLKPDVPEAQNNLGNILRATGKTAEAIAAFRIALHLKPDYAEAYYNLGGALAADRKFAEAEPVYREAISLRPGLVEAHNNLGGVLKELGRLDEAIACHHKALELRSDFPVALYNLGAALQAKGQLDDAIASYRRAIAINPKYADVHNNLGTALAEKGEFEAAIKSYQTAIQISGTATAAGSNLGVAYMELCRPVDAVECYRQVLATDPENAAVHWGLALAHLTLGEFTEGWREFEWRWKWKDFHTPARNLPQPKWDGRDPRGLRIFVHVEQALGDTIQFCRYANELARRGARVILESPPSLLPLLKNLPGMERVVPFGDSPGEFDVYIPLMSLPGLLKITGPPPLQTGSYLQADPAQSRKWRERLPAERPLIGLVWAGGDHPPGRSLLLDQLAPLASAGNLQFISLQKGPAADQAKHPPAGMRLVHVGDDLNDFGDTAAVLDNLDLLISIDTSVAHLAGAMGKPVWTLLKFSTDWRWFLNQEDTPWYPSMLLFRQCKIGDWTELIQRTASKLAGASRR